MRTHRPSRLFPLFLSLSFALPAATALAETTPMRATAPVAAPATPPPSDASSKPGGGKVLETMNAANYTYARVQTADGEKWVAGPQTPVKVGDAVQWPGGMEMKDFTSKTLARTFDSILFVGALTTSGGAAAGGAAASPHGALSGKAPDTAEVKGIKKAEGGKTIAEIYDERASLEGKEVVLRGKVVKFNSAVMGRNWIHVRDGSAAKTGENDLTVTCSGQAEVGDVVVIHGKLVLNKDFGFNYRYDVMVEDAKVAIE